MGGEAWTALLYVLKLSTHKDKLDTFSAIVSHLLSARFVSYHSTQSVLSDVF